MPRILVTGGAGYVGAVSRVHLEAVASSIRAGHLPILAYAHAPEEEGPWQPGAASRALRAAES